MTREEAIDKIIKDLGYPEGWSWYVNDVLDRKAPGETTLDRETVEVLEQFIKADIRS